MLNHLIGQLPDFRFITLTKLKKIILCNLLYLNCGGLHQGMRAAWPFGCHSEKIRLKDLKDP